jgi:hypothetical protein
VAGDQARQIPLTELSDFGHLAMIEGQPKRMNDGERF